MTSKKRYYSIPQSETIALEVKSDILTGSNEGGGGNEEYIMEEPLDLFADFDMPELIF